MNICAGLSVDIVLYWPVMRPWTAHQSSNLFFLCLACVFLSSLPFLCFLFFSILINDYSCPLVGSLGLQLPCPVSSCLFFSSSNWSPAPRPAINSIILTIQNTIKPNSALIFSSSPITRIAPNISNGDVLSHLGACRVLAVCSALSLSAFVQGQ